MGSTQDYSPFSLRLFVDKERNRVVVAEASAEFVDTLFSFLSLPLGTIIRLLSNQLEIGCINNLYQSVQKLDTQVFWNEFCKQMLLRPRNPCESLCEKLRFNVDDTEPTKYFMCESCHGGRDLLLSTFAGLKCSCGKLMNKEMKLHDEEDDPKEETRRENGVFVKGSTIYLIFDDLKVIQNSATNCVHQLVQLDYTSLNKLTLISPTVGLNEILELLRRALISKSALTDVFLGVEDGERSKATCSFTPNQTTNTSCTGSDQFYPLRITLSKSQNKILYAEAEADYFDFLFSFLTTPLGSILNLLDGKISLGSIQNLYESVKGLNSSLGTPLLLDLHVASQYGFTKQPLKLREGETCTYWYGTHVIRGNKCYENKNGVLSKKMNVISNPIAMKIFDPRSGDGRRENAVGFVRRPSLFVVTDDLHVIPFTSASSILFLEKLNVPLDDLEEHVVKIEYTEAVNLLGASLTSKAALTNGLLYLLKKPKEEGRARTFV